MGNCIYCGGPLTEPSPEHVIPRSLGAYGFVIDVCRECNERANRWVDMPIVQCTPVQRARADLGLSDERGHPYDVHYTGDVAAAVIVSEDHQADRDLAKTFATGTPLAMPGLAAGVTLAGNNVAAKMWGSDRSIDEEGRATVRNIYRDVLDESDDDAVPDPDFVPYRFMAIVKARRTCGHDPAAWERFAAKSGLGLLGGLRNGRIGGASLNDVATAENQQLVIAQLRALALPDSPPAQHPRGCAPKGLEGPPKPLHEVAAANVGDAVVFRVLLFGILAMRARVDGAQLRHNIKVEVPVRLGPATG